MNTLESIHARSVPTADRVAAAWANAQPITRRAFVAALVTSAALATVGTGTLVQRWSIAAVGVVLAVAALVDVHEHRLPNRLLAAAFLSAAVGASATLDVRTVGLALAGCGLGASLMLLVRMTRGVGMGDVKMAGVVGAGVGGSALVAAPVAIAVAASVAAGYGLLAGRRRLPLGPALWLGWAVAIAAGAAGWLS